VVDLEIETSEMFKNSTLTYKVGKRLLVAIPPDVVDKMKLEKGSRLLWIVHGTTAEVKKLGKVRVE
jgi:hypothetical protein